MRTLFILVLATLSVGCSSRNALDRHLDARTEAPGLCQKYSLDHGAMVGRAGAFPAPRGATRYRGSGASRRNLISLPP